LGGCIATIGERSGAAAATGIAIVELSKLGLTPKLISVACVAELGAAYFFTPSGHPFKKLDLIEPSAKPLKQV
jgi:hypothetical protein